jgi:hypothetical protein
MMAVACPGVDTCRIYIQPIAQADTADLCPDLIIDLDREVPKTSDNIFDLIHYTETGSQLAASIISRELLASVSLFSE